MGLRVSLLMQEMEVQSLGREDPVEGEMATHSSSLAWRIPWTEEPGWREESEGPWSGGLPSLSKALLQS